METEERQLDLHNSLAKYREKRSQLMPDITAAGDKLSETVYKDGALPCKVKRLIGMAVALGLGCWPAIIGQTKVAVEAGATTEEVMEAASVLLAIHGTTGITETWRVVKVLEELGMI